MFEEPIRVAVEKPNERAECFVKEVKRATDGESDAEGFANCERFRSELTEDDMEVGDEPKRDDEGGWMDNPWLVDACEGKERFDHGREERFAEPAEAEGSEGDAELGRAEVGVEMRDNFFGGDGASVAFFDEGFELAGADLDDGEFRGDEESVQEDEKENGGQFEEDNSRGIPLGEDGSVGGNRQKQEIHDFVGRIARVAV